MHIVTLCDALFAHYKTKETCETQALAHFIRASHHLGSLKSLACAKLSKEEHRIVHNLALDENLQNLCKEFNRLKTVSLHGHYKLISFKLRLHYIRLLKCDNHFINADGGVHFISASDVDLQNTILSAENDLAVLRKTSWIRARVVLVTTHIQVAVTFRHKLFERKTLYIPPILIKKEAPLNKTAIWNRITREISYFHGHATKICLQRLVYIQNAPGRGGFRLYPSDKQYLKKYWIPANLHCSDRLCDFKICCYPEAEYSFYEDLYLLGCPARSSRRLRGESPDHLGIEDGERFRRRSKLKLRACSKFEDYRDASRQTSTWIEVRPTYTFIRTSILQRVHKGFVDLETQKVKFY